MTLRSGLPHNIYRQYFLAKESMNSFLNTLQVLTDSTAIIYSIRILIVLLALLMGYIHTPKKNPEVSSVEKKEIILPKSTKSIINQIK